MRRPLLNLVLYFLFINGYSQEEITSISSSGTGCTVSLTGVVRNVKTKEIIPNVYVQIYKRGKLISSSTTGENASYHFNLNCGSRYNIKAAIENYTNNSKIIYPSAKSSTKELDLFLYPIKEFKKIGMKKFLDIDQIYFETDESIIDEATLKQIKNVARILKKYPQILLSIDVHTDSKADMEYALNITKDRAEMIANCLVDIGVEAYRLIPHGYGDTKLTNHCTKGVKCAEAAHRENRRIEFIVVPLN